MPRVSLRRGLICVAAATTCSFLLVSVQSPSGGWLTPSGSRGGQLPSRLPPSNPAFMQLLGHKDESSDQGSRKIPATAVVNPIFPEEEFLPSELDIPPAPPIVTNFTKPPAENLPWFLQGGKVRPTPPLDSDQYERRLPLWPNEDDGDRILNQLMFRPPLLPPEEDHPDVGAEASPLPYKKILMYNSLTQWNVRPGRGAFLKMNCPVDTCVLTANRAEASSADAIVFKDHFTSPPHQRPTNQLWVIYMLECPLHTQHFSVKNAFNLTATYRHDSDIVTPYERFVYYDPNVRQKAQEINYAANKTKQVAWFVSNCGARNNRLAYAKELSKFIGVDIFGTCGTHRCPRSNAVKCFEMLNNDYKFYLAFENSNCRDYITEKFFVNGLNHNILPVVMGAHPDDYKNSAPERSYIHVDDFESPQHLARYLHVLDKNDNLYNEYFRWKGTGEFINTFFMCRLCAVLHDQSHKESYSDINAWWRGQGTCIKGSWRQKGLMMLNNN